MATINGRGRPKNSKKRESLAAAILLSLASDEVAVAHGAKPWANSSWTGPLKTHLRKQAELAGVSFSYAEKVWKNGRQDAVKKLSAELAERLAVHDTVRERKTIVRRAADAAGALDPEKSRT